MNEIVKSDQLEARVREVATLIASNSPLTIQVTKEVVRSILRQRQPAEDSDMILKCYMSEDFAEGVKAFLEKKKTQVAGTMSSSDQVQQTPLKGMQVLDLGRHLAGPTGAMWLGDLGADVIKVESLEAGDPGRAAGPPFFQGESAFFWPPTETNARWP